MAMCRPIPKNQTGKRAPVRLFKMDGSFPTSGRETASPLGERRQGMATKTKAIKVTVDERLAEEIADKGVHCWHATNYSNGRRRVYVTFEEVKTVGASA